MSTRRPSHTDEIAVSLGDQKAVARFRVARGFLQQHLVVKREIPNGVDYLFTGLTGELHGALKELVEIEHRASRFLQFDYAQIDDYFLLRVVGGEEHQETIHTYFD